MAAALGVRHFVEQKTVSTLAGEECRQQWSPRCEWLARSLTYLVPTRGDSYLTPIVSETEAEVVGWCVGGRFASETSFELPPSAGNLSRDAHLPEFVD